MTPFLQNFYYSRFVFDLKLENDAFDQQYLHNYFRGGLGAHLKKICCFCNGTQVAHSDDCIYQKIFEPKDTTAQAGVFNTNDYPRPFVVCPTQVRGPFCQLELVFFGQGCQYINYFLYCINQMGLTGLSDKKIKFQILAVNNKGKNIYLGKDDMLLQDYDEIFVPKLAITIDQSIILAFQTPCWINHKNEQLKSFVLYPFLHSLMRRIQILIDYYQMPKEQLPYEYLNELSLDYSIEVEGEAEWVTRKRYSHRNHHTHHTGGFVGNYQISHLPPELIAILELGAIIHAGKKTTLGNGKYTIKKGKLQYA